MLKIYCVNHSLWSMSLLETQRRSASFSGLKIICWIEGTTQLGLLNTVNFFVNYFHMWQELQNAGRFYNKVCLYNKVIFIYDSFLRINKSTFSDLYWKFLRILINDYEFFIHLFIYSFIYLFFCNILFHQVFKFNETMSQFITNIFTP